MKEKFSFISCLYGLGILLPVTVTVTVSKMKFVLKKFTLKGI